MASDTILRQLLQLGKRLLERLLDINATLDSIQKGIEGVKHEQITAIQEYARTHEKQTENHDRVLRSEVHFSEEIVNAYNAQQKKANQLQNRQLRVAVLTLIVVLIYTICTLWLARLAMWNVSIIHRNERPWIAVGLTGGLTRVNAKRPKSITGSADSLEIGTYNASVEITNLGLTPSQQTTLELCKPKLDSITAEQSINKFPRCDAQTDQDEDKGFLLFPHQNLIAHSSDITITSQDAAAIRAGKMTIYIFGHVSYRGRLNQQDTISHETDSVLSSCPARKGKLPATHSSSAPMVTTQINKTATRSRR